MVLFHQEVRSLVVLVRGTGKGFDWNAREVALARSCQAMTSIAEMIAVVFPGKASLMI